MSDERREDDDAGARLLTQPAGRLTLSWVNKERGLISDPTIGYLWTDREDIRLRETRLLNVIASEGSIEGQADNLLIAGDCQHAMRTLSADPEYAKGYRGKIKLAYLDPPFNTGEAFDSYDDGLEHSIWLAMMRERLVLIRDLLAPDGSVWVHLDDSEMPYCRVLMDEIFGRSKFVASIVWQKRYSRDNRPAIGSVHDYIMIYAPLGKEAWKDVRNRIARTSSKEYRNPNRDPRGDWRPIPLDVQAGHATASQFYTVTTPGGARHDPPPGRAWSVTEQRMQELREAGRVYFGLDGRGKPNVIRYLDEDEGLVPWTWWPHAEVGHNDDSKKEILALFPSLQPFSTPKPERLMRRIIEISTDPGDLILDPFAGSGTTAAVATKLKRRWVAIESSKQSVFDFIRPRLEKVVLGGDPGGITREANWAGGSGFRLCEIADSLYQVVGDRVLLTESAKGEFFSRSVAAQLGYSYNPEGPFCGKRGRTRLAVADGIVDDQTVRSVVAALEDFEEVLIAGKAIEPGADEELKQLSRGSRTVKVPSDLLRSSKVLR